MNTEEDINARPLAALKDPKAFPAPPVHRVAHGMQQPLAAASPQPPVQPQAQPYGYQQAPGPPQQAPMQPEYAQYQQPVAAAYQPPAGPPPAQNAYQPPTGPPPAQNAYQPPAGPPPGQTTFQPPVGPPPGHNLYQPPAGPPQSAYQPPTQYGQYQPPPTSFAPPGGDPNAQYQVQPQQAAYAPPQPVQATYAPPQPAQAAYTPPQPVQAAYAPPPAANAFPPPTPGRPVPSLPPRANSATATPEPPAPVKAPLPDPTSFPKPPPYFGRQDSATSTHTAQKPSLPSRTTQSPSTFKPPPTLPQRTTPSPSVQPAPTAVAAPPSYASVPPPALPSRANSIAAPSAGASHKKPPPPPVKPKDFQRHNSLPHTPEPAVPSNVHSPSPAPAPAQPQHNQGGYGAIASQLDQAWNQSGAVGSFRDRLKSVTPAAPIGSPSPASNQATPSGDPSASSSFSVHGIASQFGQMSMHAATPNATDSANGTHGHSASFQSKVQALNQAQPNFANELASRFNPMQAQAHPAPEPHQLEPTPAAPRDPSSAAHKKAPPPPPKKLHLKTGQNTSSASASPQVAVAPPLVSTPQVAGAPPPINYATRPQFIAGNADPASQAPIPAPVAAPVPVPVAAPLPGQKEFDLQLHTLWFNAPANSLQLPPTMSGLNYALATSRSGTSQTLIIAIRIVEDLAIVKYKLSWQNTDPQGSVRAERKEVPAPAPLPQTQLIQAHEQFGNGVASWAEAMMNKQVGDGECWTLAKEAIDQSSHGYALSPQSYTHGALVYHATGGAPAPIAYNDSIRRGDILQFTNGRFETRNAQGVVTGFSTVGMPNHTSVVTSVSANNRVVEIVQQNVSGVKKVQKGSHNLDEMTQGDLKIFRPVWKEWAGELDTSW